jgi:hypothetical protein
VKSRDKSFLNSEQREFEKRYEVVMKKNKVEKERDSFIETEIEVKGPTGSRSQTVFLALSKDKKILGSASQ